MKSTTINNPIKEVREFFNEIRGSLSREEINRIRKKLYKKEAVYNFLKEKDGLTDKEKIVLKNIGTYLKKLNNDFKKLQRYQDNITYGLDYLMKKIITNQQKSRALLMVIMYYMKVEEIKMANYHYMNILIILNLI